jgi:signal peptidase I
MANKPDEEIVSETYDESEFSETDLMIAKAAEINPQTQNKIKTKSIIYDLIFYAVLIFVCVYILPNFILQRTIVDGDSMQNTLNNGDQLYVEKLSYRFDALNRFDIIVFYPYGRQNSEYYVKRIIGLPGETVQIIDGNIFINGNLLEEHFGKDPIENPGRAAEPITLGKDEYFVMGDNRNTSKDSRTEEVGNVSKENIGGRVIFRISPLSRFGTVD